jgi:hypothetical protein
MELAKRDQAVQGDCPLQAIVVEAWSLPRKLVLVEGPTEDYSMLRLIDENVPFEEGRPSQLDCSALNKVMTDDNQRLDPTIHRFYWEFMWRLPPEVRSRIATRHLRSARAEMFDLVLTVEREPTFEQMKLIFEVFGSGPFNLNIQYKCKSVDAKRTDEFLSKFWDFLVVDEWEIWEKRSPSESRVPTLRLRRQPSKGIMNIFGRFIGKVALHSELYLDRGQRPGKRGVKTSKWPNADFYERMKREDEDWQREFEKGFSDVLTWDFFIAHSPHELDERLFRHQTARA